MEVLLIAVMIVIVAIARVRAANARTTKAVKIVVSAPAETVVEEKIMRDSDKAAARAKAWKAAEEARTRAKAEEAWYGGAVASWGVPVSDRDLQDAKAALKAAEEAAYKAAEEAWREEGYF